MTCNCTLPYEQCCGFRVPYTIGKIELFQDASDKPLLSDARKVVDFGPAPDLCDDGKRHEYDPLPDFSAKVFCKGCGRTKNLA